MWRRRDIVLSLVAGGLCAAVGDAQARAPGPAARALGKYIVIHVDGRVTVVVPKCEMGQGAFTALAMIVAEELEVDWSCVTVACAPADAAFATVYRTPSGAWVAHDTGASFSVSGLFDELRQAGATARAGLVAAAARRWRVDPKTCSAAGGQVRHAASSRTVPYASLIHAVDLRRYGPVALKDRRDFRIIGRSLPRLDASTKIDGSAVFGPDTRLPGMLFAAVQMARPGQGRLLTYDATAAATASGVRAVLPLDNAVAVVATDTWQAVRVSRTLRCVFAKGEAHDADGTARALEQGLSGRSATHRSGRPLPETAGDSFTRTYATPFAAHACMEPMNCTVWVRNDTCTIWASTQAPGACREEAARALGLPESRVQVHTVLLGGGFGRRLKTDCLLQAVAIARRVDHPVQLLWTREQDFAADYFRPAATARLRAHLGPGSLPKALAIRLVTAAGPDAFPISTVSSRQGAETLPYDLPVSLEHLAVRSSLRVGPWRSVGNFYNVFFVESLIDELCLARAWDPFALRKRLTSGRARRVVVELEKLCATTGSGKALGIALHRLFDSYIAVAVEIGLDSRREFAVLLIRAVVDCGLVINPSGVKAQVIGGLMMGLSSALFEDVTGGGEDLSALNLDRYEILRIPDAAPVEVTLLRSDAPPSGAGEIGVPALAPALCNALSRLTGRRVRALPVRTVRRRSVT